MTFIKPFRAIRPVLEEINSPEAFFTEVKKNFVEYKKAGLFKKNKRESLFIYQIRSQKTVHLGLICSIPLKEYDNEKIIKHEHTLAAKEQKVISLLLKRKALIKPVLLTYPAQNSIADAIQKAREHAKISHQIYFGESKETHTFYEISNEQEIRNLQTLFEEQVPLTYVADGHHRLATSSILHKRIKKGDGNLNGYENVLCALFPTSELEIHDYNRVVEMKNISPLKLMAELSLKFDITSLDQPQKPTNKHEIVMTNGKEWFLLKWKKEVIATCSSNVDFLDVNLLNNKILSDIFKIENVATDRSVTYIEGPKGIEGITKKLRGKDNIVSFILSPVSWNDFIEITNEGVMLPPKSTWFEPRIRNGLIVYGY